MKRRIDLERYRVGRFLVHLGLRVMPPGRVKDELTEVIREWGEHVVRTVELTGANRIRK